VGINTPPSLECYFPTFVGLHQDRHACCGFLHALDPVVTGNIVASTMIKAPRREGAIMARSDGLTYNSASG
jgi:hypothetical protein